MLQVVCQKSSQRLFFTDGAVLSILALLTGTVGGSTELTCSFATMQSL